SLPAQAKLLRAIQQGEVVPLGSERSVVVDVRVIAATHRALSEEVSAKRFREDLFYRLNVIEIEVPPLRERAEDVALLAQKFMLRAQARLKKKLEGLTDAALEALRRYPWPGNVRELENEIERAAILTESTVIDTIDLSPRVTRRSPEVATATGAETLSER